MQPPQAAIPVFADVTAAAGIRFRHNNGAFGKKFLPETLGSGCAFLDFDSDGWQDVLLINSKDWPGRTASPSHPALYRNNRNGTFTDVTKQAGLAVELYGFGVAAADYDNDGDTDIYITALGPNRLFQNQGNGRYTDVTQRARVGDSGFSTSAMWFDYNRDGRLDLFVTNYVEWSLEQDRFCTLDGKSKSYCTPEAYKGRSSSLFRNAGNGTFEDVTRASGVYAPASKALGVALIDYDADDLPDVFVANDTQPNQLYRNKGDGTFEDVAKAAGVAFSEAGVARAGMGTDAADYDRSGRQSLLVGNFTNEMMALYTNEGNGLFTDSAPSSTIGRVSMLSLTFACFFFDFDLDGLLDILGVNGHVADDISRVQPKVGHAQSPNLFRNRGARRFDAVTSAVGPELGKPIVGRGAAYGDYDNDGDLDLLITTNNGPARLLRNDGGNRNAALRVKTIGTASNRDGIGSRVRLTLDNGTHLSGMVKTGSSYCSQSELPVTFGLGAGSRVTAIEVTWPTGRIERLPGVPPNQKVTIQEGKGVVRADPIGS